jgi:hypothetical protein
MYDSPTSDIFDLTQFWISCLGPLVFLLPKTLNYGIWFSNNLATSVPDESYSRNVSCALNLIYMFLIENGIYK